MECLMNYLKLMYVTLTPVVLVLIHDHVIVINWSKWVATMPLLESVPSWFVLAVAGALYAVTVWIITRADQKDGQCRALGRWHRDH